jgi:small-conductance mechanosensitive channel
MTLGEKRIRTTFNVSGDSEIDKVKQTFAKMIDALEELKKDAPPEKIRIAALTQTELETACMYYVKVLTY